MAKDFDPQTNDRIVAMHRPQVSRRDADLRAFEDYWHSLRRGADVPSRCDVDPRGIESLLSEAFVAEKIAPGLARLRIAGLHLSDLMGMEVRGMPLSALIDVQDRSRFSTALVDLFERPASLRIELAAAGGIRRAPMTGTMLILPLRSDLGDISRALGCLVSTGQIGATPRRFRITGCKITPIDITADPAPAPIPGLSEIAAPFVPAPTKTDDRLPAERPYLRLVRG